MKDVHCTITICIRVGMGKGTTIVARERKIDGSQEPNITSLTETPNHSKPSSRHVSSLPRDPADSPRCQ